MKTTYAFIAFFTLFPALSQAADTIAAAPKPALPTAAESFSWTGAYAGAEVSYAWSGGKIELEGFDESGDGDINAAAIGLFGGYRYQFDNNVVAGIDASYSYNGEDNYFDLQPVPAPAPSVRVGTEWQAGINGRLGYAWDKVLVYGLAGWSVTEVKSDMAGLKNNDVLNGWTLGAGVDYAFTKNVFGRLQASYTDFGDTDVLNEAARRLSGGLVNSTEAKLYQARILAGIGVKF